MIWGCSLGKFNNVFFFNHWYLKKLYEHWRRLLISSSSESFSLHEPYRLCPTIKNVLIARKYDKLLHTYDLVYFISRVPDTSDISATRTTRVQYEWHKYSMSETRVQHEWNMSTIRTTRVQHECYTNETSATRVNNFDFDKDTTETIF